MWRMLLFGNVHCRLVRTLLEVVPLQRLRAFSTAQFGGFGKLQSIIQLTILLPPNQPDSGLNLMTRLRDPIRAQCRSTMHGGDKTLTSVSCHERLGGAFSEPSRVLAPVFGRTFQVWCVCTWFTNWSLFSRGKIAFCVCTTVGFEKAWTRLVIDNSPLFFVVDFAPT